VHDLQVLERLKAASAFVTVAQTFTKSTKTAETKVARAAAKLNKLPSLQQLLQERGAAVHALQKAQLSVKAKEAATPYDKTKGEEAAMRKVTVA